MVEVADVRVHGTTHERPIDRFSGEHEHLMVTAGQPGFPWRRAPAASWRATTWCALRSIATRYPSG
jgi:hypothetical protein